MPSSYSEISTASLTGTVVVVGPIGPAHSFDVSISGTFVGTLVLQRFIGNGADGNWRTVKSYTGPIEDSPSLHVRKGIARIKFSAYTSGTAVVTLQATDAAMAPAPNNVVGIDPANNTVTQGAGEAHIGEVGGRNALVIATFTRPGDTTAYTANDLIANSTTPSSVAAMAFTVGRGSSGVAVTGMIRRARLRKSGKSTTNATFRIHLFRVNPITSSAVTMTNANPGVVTWVAHGLSTGCPIIFSTTGGLPTNVVAGTVYYVIKVDADSFQLASSSANAYAGTAIDTTAGAQSGVQTATAGLGGGDNAQVFVATSLAGGAMNYVGKIDVTVDQAFSDGASGNGSPAVGSEINFTSGTYYGLLEDRAGYQGISAETFTVELEVLQN